VSADGRGQQVLAHLVRQGGRRQSKAIARWTGAVQDGGSARAFLREQVKVVVEQIHFEGGLIDRAGCHGERLASDDTAFVCRTREVVFPMRRLGLVPPFIGLHRR
jgi:hypothetical protein